MRYTTYAVALLLLILLMPFAYAQSANFYLTTNEARACPYSTVQVLGYVTNTGNTVESYSVASSSRWVKIAQDSVELSPGERETIYIYITPADSRNKPGKYTIPVVLTSKTTNEKITENIDFTLMSCHYATLQPKETVVNACLTEKAPILFDISNKGKNEETFTVTSNVGDLTNSRVTLKSGETRMIRLTVPVEEASKEILLTASSETSYAKAETSIRVYGSQCYSGELSITPQLAKVCVEDGALYTISVRNTGNRTDTHTIKASTGDLGNKTLTVQPGKTGTMMLRLSPTVAGDYDITISAASAHVSLEDTARLSVSTCRGVSVSFAEQEKKVCYKDKAQFNVVVKNTGTKRDLYSLTAEKGTLSRKKIQLEGGASETVTLTIDATTINATNELSVKASSTTGVSDTARTTYSVDLCPDVSLAFDKEATICPGDTITQSVAVKNLGIIQDTYTLTTGKGTLKENNVISLAPGVSREVTWTVPTEMTSTEEETVVFTARGKEIAKDEALRIKYKSFDVCYGFELTAIPFVQTIKSYEEYERALYTVIVNNYGERQNVFRFSLDGPNWSYIDPKKLVLDDKEKGSTFVYMTPPFKVNEGVYEATAYATPAKGNVKSVKMRLVFGEYRLGNITITEQPSENKTTAEKPVEQRQKPKIETYEARIVKQNLTITSNKQEKTTIIYTTGTNKTESVDITFKVGSLVIEIEGKQFRFQNVTSGRHHYQLRVGTTVYRLLTDVNPLTVGREGYVLRVEDIDVLMNVPDTPDYQTQELAITAQERQYTLIVILGAIAAILLIIFWPRLFRKREKEKKPEEEPKKSKRKKDEERKKVKADIEKILEGI